MNQSLRCPRCTYWEQFYQAPLGKEVRNPYASPELGRVYDDCRACSGTGYVPSVVLDSIKNSLPKQYDEIMADPNKLRWSGDHFSLHCGGMYVGVEVDDGYLHT
jgi:hypothetical protein